MLNGRRAWQYESLCDERIRFQRMPTPLKQDPVPSSVTCILAYRRCAGPASRPVGRPALRGSRARDSRSFFFFSTKTHIFRPASRPQLMRCHSYRRFLSERRESRAGWASLAKKSARRAGQRTDRTQAQVQFVSFFFFYRAFFFIGWTLTHVKKSEMMMTEERENAPNVLIHLSRGSITCSQFLQ